MNMSITVSMVRLCFIFLYPALCAIQTVGDQKAPDESALAMIQPRCRNSRMPVNRAAPMCRLLASLQAIHFDLAVGPTAFIDDLV
jgi:hypothetical protein